MNFAQRALRLQVDLSKVIDPLVQEFFKETGVVPNTISVNAIDVSTYESQQYRFILGSVHLEFKL